jgi:fructokinase
MQLGKVRPNVAIGELLWDLLAEGPRLGGTTANYAILSARLGANATLLSCVGQDELGREALEQLTAVSEGLRGGTLDLSWVHKTTAHPTGTVSVELDGEGRPRYGIRQPVAWDAIAVSDGVLELAGRAGVVCFGTLAQRQEPSRGTIRAVVEATRTECVRVWDVNLRKPYCDAEVLEWCLQHATVIKVSDEELPEVAGLLEDAEMGRGFPQDVETASDGELTEAAVRAGRALLARAPQGKLCAVTLGGHGSVLVDSGGAHRHYGYPVKVVDTIGAGDAFTAGLVHAYVHGAALEAMSVVANRCGSYVASCSGATPELSNELVGEIAMALGRRQA